MDKKYKTNIETDVSSKSIKKRITESVTYRPSTYGMSDHLTGEGVKIAVVDTGRPSHSDIKSIKLGVNVSNGTKDAEDYHGHATMLSGIIGSTNENKVYGVAPKAELYFAKVTNSLEECEYSSVLAGVLWAVAKKVDVILLALGSPVDSPVLHDAIKKAYSNNICIVSALDGEESYPANYSEVLSAGSVNESQFRIKEQSFLTTYTKGRFIKSSGPSLIAALAAGVTALVIEDQKTHGEAINPEDIYKKLANLK